MLHNRRENRKEASLLVFSFLTKADIPAAEKCWLGFLFFFFFFQTGLKSRTINGFFPKGLHPSPRFRGNHEAPSIISTAKENNHATLSCETAGRGTITWKRVEFSHFPEFSTNDFSLSLFFFFWTSLFYFFRGWARGCLQVYSARKNVWTISNFLFRVFWLDCT